MQGKSAKAIRKRASTPQYVSPNLRSGTSVGANIREAINAQSPADFIHKLAIAQKECDETLYWVELLKETNYINETEFISMHTDATELLKIIRSIILTSKQKNNS